VCGITGFTHSEAVFDPARIRAATDSLIHRGPDQQGTYESERISLGAVRLKIIDLNGGEQPMFSEDGNTALAGAERTPLAVKLKDAVALLVKSRRQLGMSGRDGLGDELLARRAGTREK